MDEARCECGGSRVSPGQARRSVGVGAGEQTSRSHQARKSVSPGVDSSAPKKRKPLKRTRRRETKAEREAREHFNATVKSWPCWFSRHRPCARCGGLGVTEVVTGIPWACTDCNGAGNHVCKGPKDAHHLIPKNFIRKRFQGVLPEQEFVAILFNPKIGAPLCRKAHDSVEAGFDRVYWEDLSDECIEYVFSLPDFMALRLEEECIKRPEQESNDDELEAA